MHKPGKDGVTPAEHYAQVSKVLGEMPPEGRLPELPDCMAYLWDTFLDLRGMVGGQNINIRDVKEYAELVQIGYTSYEVRALCLMDLLRQRVLNG